MVKRASLGVACMAAASVSVLASPVETAPTTFDETVPVALVSPEGLGHRALGEALFGTLPPEHQAMIASAGGIGPRETPTAGLGVLSLDDQSWMRTDAAQLIDAETLAAMRPEHLAMFEYLAEQVRLGETIPAMCLAPDTDPKVAEAFHTFMLAIAGGSERYQYGGRWFRTAVSGSSLVIGQPTTVTYSFVPDGTSIPNLSGQMRSSNLHAWLNAQYGAGTWEGLFASVFGQWGNLTGLSYIHETNDDGVAYSSSNGGRGVVGVRGDVRIGAVRLDGNSGVLAFNYFPDYGDMVIDSSDSFFNVISQNFRRFRNVIAHEHGHGLGAAHSCPGNSTKLMEPFITTSFNGVQLDDKLFGQRGYGDKFEDNDTLQTATPLGLMDPNSPVSYSAISIDDNSDVDFFQFEVNIPVRVVVSLTPAAGIYLNGPQLSTGQCSAGTNKNYQTIHDLVVEFQDAAGNVLATVNDSPAGVVETAVIELFDAGTFYAVISGDSSNDIQLYDLDISSVNTLAPLNIEFTASPDVEIAPDTPSTVTTTIDLRDDILLLPPQLVYSIDGGGQTTVAMANQGSGVYTAQIPAIPCASSATYQVDVEGIFSGPLTLGPATTVASLGVARSVSFADDFESDRGWTVSGTLISDLFGMWERVSPTSTTANGPLTDGDGSGIAYVTGNADFLSHVSGGETILTSPVFDMGASTNPVINVSTWFDDDQGLFPGINVLLLEVSNDNGSTWSTLEALGPNNADSVGGWIPRSYTVADTIALTSTMRFRATATDALGSNIYEAGIDGFSIEDIDCDAGCPVDLNGDGIADNGDIGTFVTLFLANDLAADFNGDGILDNGDIGAFVAAFLAGC